MDTTTTALLGAAAQHEPAAADLLLPTVQTVIGAVIGFVGVLLFVVAGLGLIRFPDAYTRLTAMTKSGSLGICFILAAVVVLHPAPATAITLGLAVVLQLVTTPIGSFSLSRAAYHSGASLPGTVFNELPAHNELSDEVSGQDD